MSFPDPLELVNEYGIASVAVVLDMPQKTLCAGSIVRGSVWAKNGKTGTNGQPGRLLVRIRESWSNSVYYGATGRSEIRVHEQFYEETVLATALTLQANEPSEALSYELTVPWGGDPAHSWSVNAVFEVADLGEAEGSAYFELAPPAPIQGLITALQAVVSLTVERISNTGNQHQVDLIPTEESQKDFDGVRLIAVLEPERDLLAVALYINPQEHTPAEHLQSLLHLNNRAERIELSASAVARGADPTAAEPDAEVVAYLRTLLYPNEESRRDT